MRFISVKSNINTNQNNNVPPRPRRSNRIRQTRRTILLQGQWPIHMPRMCPQVGAKTRHDQSVSLRAPPPVTRLFRRGRIGPSQGSQVAHRKILFAPSFQGDVCHRNARQRTTKYTNCEAKQDYRFDATKNDSADVAISQNHCLVSIVEVCSSHATTGELLDLARRVSERTMCTRSRPQKFSADRRNCSQRRTQSKSLPF